MKYCIYIGFFFFSLNLNAKTIVLLGQYHLSPKQKTNDIEGAKKLPQYLNQKTIYLILNEWIQEKQLDVIMAEGCEGEIDHDFKLEFNGWNYNRLKKISSETYYEDVLTLLPLKLEAQYAAKIKTLCGDNLAKIKAHQLIFSDLRAFAGFYIRFKELKKESKKYKLYLETLEKIEKKKIKDPISYTRKKSLLLLEKEKELMLQRNQSFIKKIATSKANKLALIIGNRHIINLKSELEKAGHKVQLIDLVQETLPKENYLLKLKKILKN